MAIARECLHCIKMKKNDALLLKLDVHKAYDCVDREFLRSVLHKIGLSRLVIEWIMACITTANFGVLTNGVPSCFLKASQGSLSPLLFLLVIEGMGRMISVAHSRGSFSGMGITRNIFITHLIFVDDVLIFGNISVME